MSGKKLGAIVVIVAAVLIVAGALYLRRAPIQATAPELTEIDGLLAELEDYMTFENQDLISGLEDLYSRWG